VSGPVDAEGGTLPVNPDFVPWAHELVYHLARAASSAHVARPGEAIVLALEPTPPAGRETLAVTNPGGSEARAKVVRSAGKAQARIDDTDEPGIYQVHLPDPPGGVVYATVAADRRESELRPLEPSEAVALARDWPLRFVSEPERLIGGLFAPVAGSRHEIWRYLIMGTLAGLCMEVWLTRRMVKNGGMAGLRDTHETRSTEAPHPEGSRAR
jgi:hypothetical protein